ncbi:YgaP family membrane protein [Xylocopilactobacillus apis]|uniref:Inner membrane protein YgaP-like transmembrane domain-containing protein n=1 Tax=Xylocopilactobacillus apis TaxID=2932183 RepID=A0AAU9DNR8_9LACO|nr:hypothetical protein KIMC2_19560 [Xylocopilactobacillus apis]
MKKNVGTIDSIIRIIIGLALLSLFYFLKGNLRFIALIGFFPLITGLTRRCLLYKLFGISSCKTK